MSGPSVPAAYADLLERPIVAVLSTLTRQGGVEASPVWVEHAEGLVRFSAATVTRKAHNVAANPRVALCLVDPDNPYRYLEIRGLAVEISPIGGHEHLDAMARRYTDLPAYPDHDYGQDRLLVSVRPQWVVAHGGPRGGPLPFVAPSGDHRR